MWMPIVSTALAFGGNLINAASQHHTNQKSADLAREGMRFEERMSSTAHQREALDMQLAGRNPTFGDGGGASTPGAQTPGLTAPQVQMPELFAYGATLKELEQKDQMIAIQDKLANADIAKNLTEQQLNKMREIAIQKGMPRALLEGEAAGVMSRVIKWLKSNVTTPKMPSKDDMMSLPLQKNQPINLNFGR